MLVNLICLFNLSRAKCSGIDEEFEKLLMDIFSRDFIETYKLRRPSGWIDLMVAFESRKRSANPNKNHPLNVCLPFSFIEQHKKLRVRVPFLYIPVLSCLHRG